MGIRVFQLREMNEKDDGAEMFISSRGQVQDGIENPLWIGNTSADVENVALNGAEHFEVHALRSGTHYVSSCPSSRTNGEFSAPRFPVADGVQNGDFRHQRRLMTTDSSMRPGTTKNMQNYPRQEATTDGNNSQQTTMMNAYIEKFTPACPPYPAGPVMGYYSGGGPTCRGPSILPEVDMSHRPGSLQEAICMYIDFLMAENEVRTRISECAIASPPPPLDFHREEYYRDVICRPVNFPTARFRDWLKRYNVDIEITDPDGQTVAQTTFAPAAPVTSSEAKPGTDGSAWPYGEDVPTVPHRRRQRQATSMGVICHGGGGLSPRPVQFGPAGFGHPLLQPQAESSGIAVEMLNPSVDGRPMQGSMNFSPPPIGTGPLASSISRAQPPPPDPETCVTLVGGCDYRSLPLEEDERKELSKPVLPVSGWPDVTLEHPESSRAGNTVDSPNFEEDASDPRLSSCSTDPYFEEGGTASSGGHFDSSCFASDAAADQHWTAGVIRSPVVNRSITDLNPARLDHDDLGNLAHAHFTKTSPDHASGPVRGINNRGAFPVVIEPISPSDSCIPTGNTTTVIPEFAKCFANGGSAGYQLPYKDESDQELYRTGENAQLGDAAAPASGTTTPPSHSTDTASCLDLGSDFADLLGAQHSDEFDYHLNYGSSITSNLSSKELTEDAQHQPQLRRASKTRRRAKSATMHDAGPPCKSSRRESAER